MAIISPGNAIPTKGLTPHDTLHKRAVIGRVKWMKCADEACRAGHRKKSEASQAPIRLDWWNYCVWGS